MKSITRKEYQAEIDQIREAHQLSGAPLVKMTIETRVPDKWRFVDMETGEIFMYDEEAGNFMLTLDRLFIPELVEDKS